MWHGLLVPHGLFWIFYKLLIYWDFNTQSSLATKWPEKRNYRIATVLVGKMCCRRQKSKDNGVTALSRKEGNSNHLLQATFVEEHLWMDHISNLETDGLQQQTVDHTTYHSCQVNARIWWYNYTQACQNWSTEDQKNDPWADEVLLWHSDLVKTTSKYDSIQITADVIVQWYIPCMLVTH